MVSGKPSVRFVGDAEQVSCLTESKKSSIEL
jgi:hypothetical protein